jgi:hypothetical protein
VLEKEQTSNKLEKRTGMTGMTVLFLREELRSLFFSDDGGRSVPFVDTRVAVAIQDFWPIFFFTFFPSSKILFFCFF